MSYIDKANPRVDRAPFFTRTGPIPDAEILEKIGVEQFEYARRAVQKIGWPVPDSGSETMVFDAIQCFQEMVQLEEPRLTADRWAGELTIVQMDLCVENGGLVCENFTAKEFWDKRTGWIRARYEGVQLVQAIRKLSDGPVFIISGGCSVASNKARGSKSHPSKSIGTVLKNNEKPGSRHIWAEGFDLVMEKRVRIGDAKQLKMGSGFGYAKFAAGTGPGTGRRGVQVPVDEAKLMHGDVGGRCRHLGGSNMYAREGGVNNPTLWPYNTGG